MDSKLSIFSFVGNCDDVFGHLYMVDIFFCVGIMVFFRFFAYSHSPNVSTFGGFLKTYKKNIKFENKNKTQ